jgi:hypothetical protein
VQFYRFLEHFCGKVDVMQNCIHVGKLWDYLRVGICQDNIWCFNSSGVCLCLSKAFRGKRLLCAIQRSPRQV